jgi:glycerophosphoryl diester phosphodiesterase
MISRVNPRPLIIAHRGASADAPENTFAAFTEAWNQGADGIETDVRMTLDGRVVCIHDANTHRCGDRDLTVARATLDELQTVDIGFWKHPLFCGERIPTLRQLLRTLPPGKCIFVEIKDGLNTVPPVCREIRDSKVDVDRITIISFDAAVVAAAREAMPEIKANWLVSYKRTQNGQIEPDSDTIIQCLHRAHASGLGSENDKAVVTADFCQRLRAAGFGIHCWTFNDPEEAAYFARIGIDSITTDKPGEILTALQINPVD